MNEIKTYLLPLQFILSLVLLMCCLHELAHNENVILSELCKAVAAVAIVSMLAAASGNSLQKTNNPIEKKNNPYENS